MPTEKTLDDVLTEHDCMQFALQHSHEAILEALEAETTMGPALTVPLAQKIREGIRGKYIDRWKEIHGGHRPDPQNPDEAGDWYATSSQREDHEAGIEAAVKAVAADAGVTDLDNFEGPIWHSTRIAVDAYLSRVSSPERDS